MEQLTKLMMQLIASEASGEVLKKSDSLKLSGDCAQKLYSLSDAHDVAHLVGSALEKNGLLNDGIFSELFREKVYSAFFRYERLNYEFNQICELLEKAQIKFIPLKGAVMRSFYSQGWMRTSCDIDILVEKEELPSAQSLIIENLGYSKQGESAHDVSLISANSILVELHYDLVESGRANSASDILKNVWDYSYPRKNYRYLYDMDNSMFYLYHIAHIAKHFEGGGCGVRPLLDLWMMEKKADFWNQKTAELLKQSNLYAFAGAVRCLSQVWFGGKAHDEITKKMESYIITGGVYGDKKTEISIRQHKAGGRYRYILSRIFLPYEKLKYQYPILHSKKWLTPFYEVIRWINLISGKKTDKQKSNLQATKSVPDGQAEYIAELLNEIGL